MNKNEYLKANFGITDEIIALTDEVEEKIKKQFKRIADIAQINQLKVMKAFADNNVGEANFASTTGYGYDDIGRDTLDKVYAQAFDAEDAMVRHNLVNGTHALSTMMFGILRPGDLLVAASGKPYDTLEEVIGITGEGGSGSLKDFGVEYKEIALLEDGTVDVDTLEEILKSTRVKAVMLQRSKGYGWRPTYSPEYIGEIIARVKAISPDTLCIVDNCYGEFTDIYEPTHFGADLMAGSLIKNPGGGIAPTGGYIAGRKALVELCGYRLTSVGIGKEAGASIGMNRYLYQGFFMAPHTTSQALKSALLCSAIFDKLGFEVAPKPDEIRYDIIQSVKLEAEDKLIDFCRGIQKGAPVDSFVDPEPCVTPGYADKVIMAAGAFVQGASIELSADAPVKAPYIVYMQGGLTYESAKLGIMMAAQNVKKLM